MPVSLLTLPYELREQILTSLLRKSGSIKLQQPVESPAVFTPPISQVCAILREETIRIFYHINTFTWTIDPEADLTDPADYALAKTYASDKAPSTNGPLRSMLPWLHPSPTMDLRHLRLDLYLPDPYNKKLWMETLATQLAQFTESIDGGNKLKDLRILIATWHRFRELSDWQADVLRLLERVTLRGHVQVRTRSLDGKLKAALQSLDLTSRIRDESMPCARDLFEGCVEIGERNMDWEWEGGVII